MKYITIIIFILLFISSCSEREMEFTRIITGYSEVSYYSDSSSFDEIIIVKNIPQDKLLQSKIMISYADSLDYGFDSVKNIDNIMYYFISFYESTRETRKYFIELKDVPYSEKKNINYNSEKTYLGYISYVRCRNDKDKWKISLVRNITTGDPYENQHTVTETHVLMNDCDSCWYKENSGGELVEYFNTLHN